jgi:hypothetical protein
MSIFRFFLLSAVASLALTSVQAQSPIVFFARVTEVAGAPLSTLTTDDLEVHENGVEGKILKIEPINWPVRVQLMVDNGIGLKQELMAIRNGVKGFIAGLPDGVEMTLITTAPQPRFIMRPTADKKRLLQGADLIVPDDGAAQFVDALNEAATRIDADRGNYFPVVVIVGSTLAEGSVAMKREVNRTVQRFADRAATVHVIIVSTGKASGRSVPVTNQAIVGEASAHVTGGRFENIVAATRLETMLPEIAAQIAKSHERQSTQFRISVERPKGAKGPIGEISAFTRPSLTISLTPNGRMP